MCIFVLLLYLFNTNQIALRSTNISLSRRILFFKESPEKPVKPVYAAGDIEWGAWSDTHAHVDKYWYWGFLRK